MNAKSEELPAADDGRDLYRELVLRHARTPQNFGCLPSPTHGAEGVNTLCGDKLALYLDVSPEGRIETIRFDGSGCAISLASASMMTEAVGGQLVADALSIGARFEAALNPDGNGALGDSDLAALTAVRRYPSRVRCATLPWRALERAVAGPANAESQTVTTE